MRTGKLSVNEIKIKNRQMIYQHIRAHGPVSKQDIVVALQLSLPTVTQNLEYLKEHGLIDDSQQIKNTGGRNATAYTYIKDAKQAMGVYISAHHMNVVALDLAGGNANADAGTADGDSVICLTGSHGPSNLLSENRIITAFAGICSKINNLIALCFHICLYLILQIHCRMIVSHSYLHR